MQDTTGRINVEIMAMSMCTRPDTDSGDHEKPAENEYPDRHRPVACHDNGQFQRFRDERYRSFASCHPSFRSSCLCIATFRHGRHDWGTIHTWAGVILYRPFPVTRTTFSPENVISAASSAARLLSSLLPFYDDFDSFTVVVFVFPGSVIVRRGDDILRELGIREK